MYRLRYGKSTKVLAEVVPDNDHADMWRIRWPDGELSDMVNLSRAKDAARVLVRSRGMVDQSASKLRWEFTESAPEASPVRYFIEEVLREPSIMRRTGEAA